MPGAGYAIDLLPGRGFDRARTFPALARNVRTAWDTVVAFARALSIVRRTRPAVVVGVGGYASLPALVAGRLLRIPAVIHEADAHPGLANRIAVRLGARPAVSLPDTPLRGAVVTGNPVRPEIVSVERAPREPPMVAVVGGSLGARRINVATLELYDLWRHRRDVVIHHVTGARGYEECRQRLSSMQATGDTLDYRLIRYEDHMDTLYANATVMLCRSGGMTAELAVVGIPSILVPLPGAPGDHQTRNAEVFARVDAAVIVPDRELDGTRRRARARRAPRRPVSIAIDGKGCPFARPHRCHRTFRRSGRGGGACRALNRISTFRCRAPTPPHASPPHASPPPGWRRWHVPGAEYDLDLSVPRAIHIVGLGGSIMSAFAAVLVRMGHRVSGSDLRDSRALEAPARDSASTRVSVTMPPMSPMVSMRSSPRPRSRRRTRRSGARSSSVSPSSAVPTRNVRSWRCGARLRSPGATARPRRPPCSR